MESDILKVETIFLIELYLLLENDEFNDLPDAFLGVRLFLFLSLSSKDANSSSELDELSTLVGVKTLVGVSSGAGVLREGTVKGEAGGIACELPTLLYSGGVLALALG